MTPDEFFADHTDALRLFHAVRRAVENTGPCTTAVTKSQIAFKRKSTFAAVWMPGQSLRRETAPLVLSVFTRKRIPSRRWKQVVEPAPGRFSHHLELYNVSDVDEEVAAWIKQAWEAAGPLQR